MTLQTKHWVAALLTFSGVALASLVPGGPIETRSFAHINSLTLGAFNTFLTALALSSFLLVYFVLKSERWAMFAAAICGLSFLVVYVLDLTKLFPVSPDAMPPALLVIELLGAIIALPLLAFSIRSLQSSTQAEFATVPVFDREKIDFSQAQHILAIIALGLIGAGIITFATRSAMGI